MSSHEIQISVSISKGGGGGRRGGGGGGGGEGGGGGGPSPYTRLSYCLCLLSCYSPEFSAYNKDLLAQKA